MVEDGGFYWSSLRASGQALGSRTRQGERERVIEEDLLERGFEPSVRVSGSVAMVWYPYDIYLDGDWLHCGVNVFSLLRSDDGWKIASITYSADQPPVCAPHPDGPPAAAEAPAS